MKIIPSLASANQADLRGELARLNGIDSLHLDIEDGNFIPNITFGLRTIRDVSKLHDMKMDAHLMVTNPYLYIDALAKIGIASIAAHFECMSYPMEYLRTIKGLGMKAGIAINPKTITNGLYYYADKLDYVLVMTAEPDTSGQEFQPNMLEKIAEIRKTFPETMEIWVDGGIKEHHLADLSKAGANVVIMGRAVFGAENPVEFIKTLEQL